MSQLLDLQVKIATRPLDASSETVAPFTLRCEALKLEYNEGVFSDPLTKKEQDDLRWYLEEYWKWPFEGFAQRGSSVEQLLPVLGQRLYQAVFGQNSARDIIQQWQANTNGAHQISIMTTDAGFLGLPWELLHDGHDFLALQTDAPISIVRRIAEEQQLSPLLPEVTFEKPIRVLLVTARPVDEGQVDARTIAHEVVDMLQEQRETGSIELEFLRPPTLDELIARLSKKERPIHILHFDGHGEFYRFSEGEDGINEEGGRLFFEKDDGKVDRVDGASLVEMLRYGGVQVAILNACRSAAIGEKDISNSIAVQLLKGGLQGIVAMSARVTTTSAALYVKAFYGALAAGGSIQVAHGQAQQALREHLERNLLQRLMDEAGKPVNLQDWWLPHLYVQHSLALHPLREESQSQQSAFPPTTQLPNSTLPVSSPYTFTGRSTELLQIERSLLHKKIVVISGFGGIGKTVLAREVAEWLTRTKMYDRACFISFEQGGDASVLLNVLGNVLAINDGNYYAYDPPAALEILAPHFKQLRVLIIADNIENILPGGDAALDDLEREELWKTLAQLRSNGAGVLITSRNVKLDDQWFAPGTQADYLELKGLAHDDAYALAVQVMNANRIDLAGVPYVGLRDLLAQLDHHPLAIRLVLPTLQRQTLAKVQADFASLLPMFQDDEATGRNRSLLVSLDYSLRRLNETQRDLLPRLAIFEGGANEAALLAITDISAGDWATLRQVLEQVALLTAEPMTGLSLLFLHFHPVLVPFLRSQQSPANVALCEHYTKHYADLAHFLYREDHQAPQAWRALVQKELPNLRKVLEWLLKASDLKAASAMAEHITWFLVTFGLTRERDEVRRRISEAMAGQRTQKQSTFTHTEYLQENGLGEDEFRRGNIHAAYERFTTLLARIEALPEGAPLSSGSQYHCLTLAWLARCLRKSGRPAVAKEYLYKAYMINEALIKQEPENEEHIRTLGALTNDLADVLRDQSKYTEARDAYEKALEITKQLDDPRSQAVIQMQLGTLALQQHDYVEAKLYYKPALQAFQVLDEPAHEAGVWHQLGMVAEDQEDWAEAERCYRESLAINERFGDAAAVNTYNQLALIAKRTGRPTEAEGWYRRAIELDAMANPGSPDADYLHNFAYLLLSEVQAGRASTARLAEAKRAAELALAIQEKFDTSSKSWTTLFILAEIAQMEGQAEEAQTYRRRERETFAAFEGNRDHVNLQHKSFIATVVAAAWGDLQAYEVAESLLSEFEAEGRKIPAAIRRIWAGERDWHMLVEEMDNQDALLILCVLETIATRKGASEMSTPEEIIASLPAPILHAILQEDQAAFEQALVVLAPEEQQTVLMALQVLQEQVEDGDLGG